MYINFLHILNKYTYTFERHFQKSGLTLNSNSLHLFCFHLKLEGVTPEPDSNEDSSDFMYEGITIEPPTPNPTSHPSDLFTISFTQSSIPVPQDGNNPSSSSSLTSFSSKPETVRLANNGYEEKRTSLGAESPQGTYSDVLEKVIPKNSSNRCNTEAAICIHDRFMLPTRILKHELHFNETK